MQTQWDSMDLCATNYAQPIELSAKSFKEGTNLGFRRTGFTNITILSIVLTSCLDVYF
jgi:hypothetical protein